MRIFIGNNIYLTFFFLMENGEKINDNNNNYKYDLLLIIDYWLLIIDYLIIYLLFII